ncbi:hypothetical protein D3C71_2132070 [compost metagenome]
MENYTRNESDMVYICADHGVSPTYLYEGCAEEYEDLADIVSAPLRSIPKGVRIA